MHEDGSAGPSLQQLHRVEQNDVSISIPAGRGRRGREEREGGREERVGGEGGREGGEGGREGGEGGREGGEGGEGGRRGRKGGEGGREEREGESGREESVGGRRGREGEGGEGGREVGEGGSKSLNCDVQSAPKLYSLPGLGYLDARGGGRGRAGSGALAHALNVALQSGKHLVGLQQRMGKRRSHETRLGLLKQQVQWSWELESSWTVAEEM